MKNITSKINVFVMGIVAFSMVFAPAAIAARGQGQNLSSATAGVGEQNFCTKFPTLSQKYQQEMNKQIANQQSRIDAETQKVLANRQTFDANLKQERSKWSQNRQAIYAKLTARAVTSNQKQAVVTFQNSIEAAVNARESAIDAARTAYRQGFDQLVTQHRAAVKQVLTNFQTAVQAAIQQATSDCSSGVAPATIRQNFQTALQAARVARTASAQQIDKVSNALSQLQQTRDAAIQSALQAFQSAMQSAVSALKAAFAQSQTSAQSQSNVNAGASVNGSQQTTNSQTSSSNSVSGQ